jgi:hypothetical protein
MFSRFLITIVLVPVLLGMFAARGRSAQQRLLQLLAFVAVYDVLYMFVLYYLRYRWVG